MMLSLPWSPFLFQHKTDLNSQDEQSNQFKELKKSMGEK